MPEQCEGFYFRYFSPDPATGRPVEVDVDPDGHFREAETRALIVQENLRYAKRQLTWFRRRPEYTWIDLEAAGGSKALIRILSLQ